MNKFNIGDVVVMKERDRTGGVAVGSIGTVVNIALGGYCTIGIEWDLGTDFVNSRGRGHSCDGKCEDFRGWYVCPKDIRHAVVSLENE